MSDVKYGVEFIKELDAETTSTRKCLERIPMELFQWKPHEKSMQLGYLVILVAQIPKWIAYIVDVGEIDLATFPQGEQPKTTQDLVKMFEDNVAAAKKSLQKVSNEEMATKMFTLKNQGQVLFTSTKLENVSSSINHMVHHRGQLTVYMRLNDIPVPSIYGPSADDKSF